MERKRNQLATLFVILLLSGTLAAETEQIPAVPTYLWDLPTGFSQPQVPQNNLMTADKVRLGRLLFSDLRLSGNETVACETCHQPPTFGDKDSLPNGTSGEPLKRHSISLINLAYNETYGWADNTISSLEAQMLKPFFNDDPPEMGLAGNEEVVLARLQSDPDYPSLFRSAFPDSKTPVTLNHVIQAIATFERTLVFGDSAYDRWLFHDERLGESGARGMKLFLSDEIGCARCHNGLHFRVEGYFNTGLASSDRGLSEITGNPLDDYKFRVPSLRNVGVTAPYMHDGRFKSLDEVLRHYARGPNPEIGLVPFELNERDREDLTSFLNALTDQTLLDSD